MTDYGTASMMIFAFCSDLIWLACQQIFFLSCLSVVSHVHQHHFQIWYNSSFQHWCRQKYPLNTQEPLFPLVLSFSQFRLPSWMPPQTSHLSFCSVDAFCKETSTVWMALKERNDTDAWLLTFHMLLCIRQPEIREWQVSSKRHTPVPTEWCLKK